MLHKLKKVVAHRRASAVRYITSTGSMAIGLMAHTRGFIVFMTGKQPGADTKTTQQLAGMPCILCSHEFDLRQHSLRPKADIIEIADRRGDHKQGPGRFMGRTHTVSWGEPGLLNGLNKLTSETDNLSMTIDGQCR